MKTEELLAVWCALLYINSRIILPQRRDCIYIRKYTATHVLVLDPAENTLYKKQEIPFFFPLQAYFARQQLDVL